MNQTELKDGILDLFDQIREANTRYAEKESIIDSLTEKINAVLENQWQQKLDIESRLA